MHTFVFLGILVSLLVTECTGFSPGGVVVVGYLAMFVQQPKWIVGTLLAAMLTYFVIELLKSHMLLYGRRLFAVYVLTGMFVAQIAAWLWLVQPGMDFGLLVIGYLVPGLIARDFARQGTGWTVLWLGFAVIMTCLLSLLGEGWLW